MGYLPPRGPWTARSSRPDGADLVLVMTREHVRDVVVLDRDAWSRTFTLKELVRRAQGVEPPSAADGVAGWLRRLGEGRRAPPR